jgi:hypothetical protein
LKLFFALLVSGVLPLTAADSGNRDILHTIMTHVTGCTVFPEITDCIAGYVNDQIFACGFVFHDPQEKRNKMVLFDDFDFPRALSRAKTCRENLLCVIGLDYDKQLHYLVRETISALRATSRNGISRAYNPANQGIWFESDVANYLRTRVPDGVDFDVFAAECAKKMQAEKEPYTLLRPLCRSNSYWRPFLKKSSKTRLDSLVTAMNSNGMPIAVQNIVHDYLDEETIPKEFFCALRPPAEAVLVWTHSFARNGALAGLPVDSLRVDAVSHARHAASSQLVLRDILGPIDGRYRQDLVDIARAFVKTKNVKSATSCYLSESADLQEKTCLSQ